MAHHILSLKKVAHGED